MFGCIIGWDIYEVLFKQPTIMIHSGDIAGI